MAVLIPNFTIRWILGMTVVMAVVFFILAKALAGSVWAIGASAAIVALGLAAVVYAVFFMLVWLVGVIGSLVTSAARKARRERQ